MKHLLTRLEKHGIGSRAYAENDFWQIVEKENINVIESDETLAFSFTAFNQKFIVIPKKRKGLKRLFSLFHELAHLLLMNGTQPAVAFQGLKQCDHDKAEAEADAIALVMLIPKDKLMNMAFLDGSRYGGKLWNERVRLYFLYGI